MTEGEKRCGITSFLPMSCRGRAEAFARRLHSRLRSLGSQDVDDTCASESSWLASNEKSNSVTSLQPRHGSDTDLFMDFGIFDSPGSPEEEIAETDLTKFITNAKDDLNHHANLDECNCIKSQEPAFSLSKRTNSIDSDSSDGLYYDPENADLEQNLYLTNHVNGLSSNSLDTQDEENGLCEEEDRCLPCDMPSSECTLSSLSCNISEDDPTASLSNTDSLTDILTDENTESFLPALDTSSTSGWRLNLEPKKLNNNNNVFSAIDLESLKCNSVSESRSFEDCNSIPDENTDDYSSLNSCPSNDISKDGTENESYCSQLNIQHNLTVECPDSNLRVEISTLEIPESENCEIVRETDLEEASIKKSESYHNHLQVSSAFDENECDTDVEDRIPRVRRCSSLKTGKTPPGTPGRKKIVRFADVLGLDLADVRTFMDEIPKIPISAYDDLSDADLNIPLSDSPLSSSPRLNSLHQPTKTLVPLFQQPGGEANFLDRVRDQQVCLENAILQDPVMLCVCGIVRVRNLDFNKSVHVRYTMDSWKTYADLIASYVPNSCDGFSDKFSFTLYVHTLSIGQRVEFAVRFQCKGCQYWDNNGGSNYVFQCLSTCTNTPYLPITVADEASWAGAAFY